MFFHKNHVAVRTVDHRPWFEYLWCRAWFLNLWVMTQSWVAKGSLLDPYMNFKNYDCFVQQLFQASQKDRYLEVYTFIYILDT